MWLAFLIFITYSASYIEAVNLTLKHDELPKPNWFLDQIFNNTDSINLKDFDKILFKLEIKNAHDHEHDHDHDHRRSINATKCYNSHDLLEIHNIDEENDLITRDEFSSMANSLIWLATKDECKIGYNGDDHHHHHDSCVPTKEKYLFGSLSVILIWLFSLIACSLIGRLKNHRDLLIITLRALAIGTLLGDAFLHIIPSSLGLHSHDDDEHDHSHDHSDHERTKNDPIWKMMITMSTIFLLWIFECAIGGHNHDHDHHDHHDNTNNSKTKNDSNNLASNSIVTEHSPANEKEFTIVSVKTNKEKITNYFKAIQTNGWIAFFGDILHKTADGFAIGASFSESISLGLSTSLAIFFHEIPHELGDYGVLISAGFSHCTVLLLNSFTSLFSLVSFFIIVSIKSTDERIREYIFAITSGVFIYIALANMIPRIKSVFEVGENKNKKRLFLVIGFFLLGWLMMFLLAIFEEDIKFDISAEC